MLRGIQNLTRFKTNRTLDNSKQLRNESCSERAPNIITETGRANSYVVVEFKSHHSSEMKASAEASP